MPFVYPAVRDWEGKPLRGNGSCVTLIKELTPGLKSLSTANWTPGLKVVGSTGLTPGTAIATFEKGRYPNRKHGNHAAFFLAYAGAAIWVVDQWPNDKNRSYIGRRVLHAAAVRPDGSYADPSNSAGAYCVLELRPCAPSC